MSEQSREKSLSAQQDALNRGAGLLELVGTGLVEAHGRDRIRYLNSMLSNDLARLGPGQGARGLLLTVQGKVISELRAYVLPEHLSLHFEAALFKPGMEMLDRYLIADKVTWVDRSEALRLLSLQGPEAASVLARALGVALPSEPHAMVEGQLGPHRVQIFAEARLGGAGFDLLISREGAEELRTGLLEQGATAVDQAAWDLVRVERGIPAAGAEVGERTIPLEAGAWYEEQTISYHKGCYLGQEVVCRAKSRGQVNWMLTGFEVPVEAAAGQELFNAEKRVGWLTSIVDSPTSGRIALGYAHRNAREAGARLRVGSPTGSLEVIQHELPFA